MTANLLMIENRRLCRFVLLFST
uniref:Uncharacterized protein n=1 Tax=Anguilla anguilla TaxID=7936 RepID=A0A0E9UQB3_ANGAN